MKFVQFAAIFALITLSSTLSAAPLPENNQLVKAGDRFVTLLGTQQQVNHTAPDFKVVNGQFQPVTLRSYQGSTLLISVVPSLDTGVCSLQTKRFNESVASLPAGVKILTISADLPFAQKRFCQAEKVESLEVLSDSVWRNFGETYGLLIKDMGLLARAIIIIDGEGVIRYQQIVDKLSNHPDYDAALAALTSLSKK